MKLLKYFLLIITLVWIASHTKISDAAMNFISFTSFSAADTFCNEHYCVWIRDHSEPGSPMYDILYDDEKGGPGEGQHPDNAPRPGTEGDKG